MSLRVALIGCGRWGRHLLRVLSAHPRVELKVVCDRDGSRLEGPWPDPRIDRTTDACAALERPDLDLVYLATGAIEHAHLGRAALDRGLHLAVEKPLARNTPDALALVDAAERAGRRLIVGHLLHAHPAWIRIRDGLTGEIGRAHHLEGRRTGWDARPAEGSAWWSLAPHDLGLAVALWGLPAQIAAQALLGAVDGHTAYHAVLRWRGGETASLSGSLAAAERTRRVEILGNQGSFTWDDTMGPAGLRHHERGADSGRILCFDPGEPLRLQVDAIAAHILDGKAAAAPLPLPLDVVRLLDCGATSMVRGGVPISMECP